VGNRTIMKSALFIVIVSVVLVAIGTLKTSGPSDATIESDKTPIATTTTEAPPEGISIVHIDNGVFRPANLKMNLDEVWIVRWINDDDVEYLLQGSEDEFEEQLAPGDSFEFDYSTLEPDIHRYRAFVGFNRIPGSVDTRPEQ
jgi:hypothetical protein